jgi:hypothetical protein
VVVATVVTALALAACTNSRKIAGNPADDTDGVGVRVGGSTARISDW